VESIALRSQLRGQVTAAAEEGASSAPLCTSAYAARRDQHLVSHTGAEVRQPRYLNMERPPVRIVDRSVEFNAIGSVGKTRDIDVLTKVVAKVKYLQSGDFISSIVDTGVVDVDVSRNFGMSNEVKTDCQAEISIGCSSTTTCSANNLTKMLSGSGTVYNSSGDVVKAKIPPKKILKHVGQAIKEWGMIEDGDRLLLGKFGAALHYLVYDKSLGIHYP